MTRHGCARRIGGARAPVPEERAMAGERDWNAEVIAEFRANGGEVTSPYDDPPPMLLVHTIGARSGREHTVPMRAIPDLSLIHI